jgi:hypothetical protein
MQAVNHVVEMARVFVSEPGGFPEAGYSTHKKFRLSR